jgi:hypothetical protein
MNNPGKPKKDGLEQGHDDSAVPNQLVVPVLFLLILWRNLFLCQRAINFDHGQRVSRPRPLTPRRPVSHGNLSTIIEKRCCTVNVREHF